MTPRSVTTVVAERNGLGESHVESEWTGHRHRDLGHFESVSEACALMVVGEHEHLGLAGQSTKGRGVQDAIAIAFEAGAIRVGFLGNETMAGAHRARGQTGQTGLGEIFARLALEDAGLTAAGPRIGVGHDDRVGDVAGHGAGPTLGTFGDVSMSRVVLRDLVSGPVVLHDVEVTSGVCRERCQ